LGKVGVLSPELEQEYPLWRIWLKTGTPVHELRKWLYIDVLKANAILDMKEDQEAAYYEMSAPKDTK
jgi:hypothetical protein